MRHFVGYRRRERIEQRRLLGRVVGVVLGRVVRIVVGVDLDLGFVVGLVVRVRIVLVRFVVGLVFERGERNVVGRPERLRITG